MAKTIRIRCVLSCGGEWGHLQVGELRDLDSDIAESLILGGLALEVGADGAPLAEDQKKEV